MFLVGDELEDKQTITTLRCGGASALRASADGLESTRRDAHNDRSPSSSYSSVSLIELVHLLHPFPASGSLLPLPGRQ